MLLSNCRMEKNNHIHFYEQDILLDDNTYSGDIDITLQLDYITPGIGIALIVDEGLSLNEMSETYLYKIGHNDYSLIRSMYSKNEVIDNGALINVKPYMENMIFRLRKNNNRLTLYINGTQITSKYLPIELNNFYVGYYSNAGNILKSISIASEIPNGWVVNMDNTNGGYIKFSQNKFSITNCSDLAEIEQVNIPLKANDEKKNYYYLRFEKELVNNLNDIKVYVFESDDTRILSTAKNILTDENKFILKKDTDISLRFEGTTGIIKNIQITNSLDDLYVPTDNTIISEKESYMQINILDLKKIEFDGTIYNIPIKENIYDKEKYSIIEDAYKQYTVNDYAINIGKECLYNYTIDLENKDLLTIKGQNEIKTFNLNINEKITIFKNIDGEISNLLLYKKDGTCINVLIQDTKKQYVPSKIKSPIIVTNEFEIPLNLSSSFRIIEEEGISKYIFTNIEREVFEPTNRINLASKISSNLGTVTIYGILKNSNINESNIFVAEKNNLKSITKYCDSYTTYDENDLYSVNKDSGTIIISDLGEDYIKNKYKKIVVDYLKKDNYSINYNHDFYSYEVDISSNEKTIIRYDGANEKNLFANITEYKIIDSEIKNNSYIVIKGR